MRGIGVAVSVSTCTSARSCFSRSLCATPKCCSSSTTTRPRSLKATFLPSSACVPITMSMSPEAMPGLVSLSSAEVTSREACPIFTGKPRKRSAKVLVCWRASKRRRHHDRDLLAVHRRDEGGAQRDLGLAEADVAADQPVHRPALAEILDRGLDRGLLVFGLLVGEAGAEFVVETRLQRQTRRLARSAARPPPAEARRRSRGCGSSSAPCASASPRRRAGRARPRYLPSRSARAVRYSRPAGRACRRRHSGVPGSHAARPPLRSSSSRRSGRCRGRHGRPDRRRRGSSPRR